MQDEVSDSNVYYTMDELAQLLKISLVSVYRLLKNGEIEYVSFGKKSYRVSERAVEEFIERKTVKAKNA